MDAKEKEGNYKLAKVVHIEDKEVSIRFEDFDEYRRDCVILSLFRSCTSIRLGWHLSEDILSDTLDLST